MVEQYRVVFEVRRALIPASPGLRVIGFDVFLIGHHSVNPTTPGCTRCQRVWADLGVLAHAAIPRPRPKTRFAVRPFDHALHYGAGADPPAEVELVIEVRHRSEYSSPIDDCENECLGRLMANLRSYGIKERGGVPCGADPH